MSFVVHTAGTGRKAFGIAAGLRWVVVEASTSNKKKLSNGGSKLIRLQGQRIGASLYVKNPLQKDICGYYNDPIGSGSSARLARVYSLSALFLKSLQDTDLSSESSVLLLQPAGFIDKRVIIVIEDGSIVTDMVTDQVQAIEQVKDRLEKNPDTRFFSQLDETGYQHTTISWEDMAEMVNGKDKSALLKPLPKSPWLPILASAGIVSVAGLMAYQKLEVEPAARRKAMIEAQKNDKTPEYIAAADAQLMQAGWDRANFSVFIDELRIAPVFMKGWKINAIYGDQTKLRFVWKRHGGSVDDLIKAFPKDQTNYQDSTLDSTVLERKNNSKSMTWSRGNIGTYQEALALIRPKLQILANAGIGSTLSEPTKWIELGTEGVNPDAQLSKFVVEVETPFQRVTEVISLLPEMILIKSFELSISDNDLRMKLKGTVYVK